MHRYEERVLTKISFFKTSKYREKILHKYFSFQQNWMFGCMMTTMIIITVMNTFARRLPLHSSPPDIARQMLGEEAEAGSFFF